MTALFVLRICQSFPMTTPYVVDLFGGSIPSVANLSKLSSDNTMYRKLVR